MDKLLLFLVCTYLIIFLVIIGFDIGSLVSQRKLVKRIDKKSLYLYKLAKDILNEYHELGYVKDETISFLASKLPSRTALASFNEMLMMLEKDKEGQRDEFLIAITKVFCILTSTYKHKMKLSKSYFAYSLSKYDLDSRVEKGQISSFLIEICGEKSLYVRENALRALVKNGDDRSIVRGLDYSISCGRIQNRRVITDCLFLYKGDNTDLLKMLLENVYSYPIEVQIGVLNYLRLSSSRFKEFSLSILRSGELQQEAVYACLRYFATYPYLPAKEEILKIANNAIIKSDFSLLAVVASTLVNYPCDETKEILLKGISCPLYYARLNSANSLLALYPNKIEKEVSKLNDKYALDMINYCIQNKQLFMDQMKEEERYGSI